MTYNFATKKQKYSFYNDPGHGWLKVSLKELKDLGIADKITGYSYMTAQFAYLEEDCDVTTFHNAIKEKYGLPDLKLDDYTEGVYSDKPSHVRNYRSYDVANDPGKEWLRGAK